jgi:hypothetical protein
MISDTLAEAVAEIDYYLADPGFGYREDPALAARIERVRAAMISLSVSLDGGAAFYVRGMELSQTHQEEAKAARP